MRLTLIISSDSSQNCDAIWNGKLISKHTVNVGVNSIDLDFDGVQDTNDLRLYFLENQGKILVEDMIVNGMSFTKSRHALTTYLFCKTFAIGLNGKDTDYRVDNGHALTDAGYVNLKIDFPFEKWFFKTWQTAHEETYDNAVEGGLPEDKAEAEEQSGRDINESVDPAIRYHDNVLKHFLSSDWTQEKQKLKTAKLVDYPFLPLDMKIDASDLKIIHEKIKLITKNEKRWNYGYNNKPEPGADKIWYYGMKSSEKSKEELYKEYFHHISRKDLVDLDRLEESFNGTEFGWHTDIPELSQFVDSIPCKKLYNAEGINYAPNGRGYVHTDKEMFYRAEYLNDLPGRLYLPLEWSEGANFAWAGFGNMPVESGRLYVINSRFIHGSWNKSTDHRYSIIMIHDPRTEEFGELVKRSQEKFLQTF